MSNSSGLDRATDRLATLRERLVEGMDRREFLRTVAATGYALGMARFLDVEEFLTVDDGEVPVVTALVREDPSDPWSLTERTRSVPADWYARVSYAFELHERLTTVPVSGILASAVRPSSYDRGTAAVSVQVDPDDLHRVRPLVDELFHDVTIEFEEIEGLRALEEDAPVGEPRIAADVSDGHVPGGVRCETEGGYATLGPALYDPDSGRRYFTTAAHAYDAAEAVGSPLYLPLEEDDRIQLGAVERAHRVADFVAVEPSDGFEPVSQIDGASPPWVTGQLTRWGLADLAARGEELRKVGSQTGISVGEIHGIDAITCYTGDGCRRGQLQWGEERDLTDGDSGSVSFYPDEESDEGVLIASINNARTWWPGQNFVWGVAAYHLTEQYGYHF